MSTRTAIDKPPPMNSRLTGDRRTPTDAVIVRPARRGRFSTRRKGARHDLSAPLTLSEHRLTPSEHRPTFQIDRRKNARSILRVGACRLLLRRSCRHGREYRAERRLRWSMDRYLGWFRLRQLRADARKSQGWRDR